MTAIKRDEEKKTIIIINFGSNKNKLTKNLMEFLFNKELIINLIN